MDNTGRSDRRISHEAVGRPSEGNRRPSSESGDVRGRLDLVPGDSSSHHGAPWTIALSSATNADADLPRCA